MEEVELEDGEEVTMIADENAMDQEEVGLFHNHIPFEDSSLP